MLDTAGFSPLVLALHHLTGLWSFVCSFFAEESDTPPPRPTPAADPWAEERFAALLAAGSEPGDCGAAADTPPTWLEPQKLARARRLHERFWPSIDHAQVISLFLSFTFAETARPLVATRRSDTAPRARRRYLETALHVLSWAFGDVWAPGDAAHGNAERVRRQHGQVARRLEGREPAELPLPADWRPPPAGCPAAALQRDLGDEKEARESLMTSTGCPARALSQRDMVLTQWFFVGLLVLHPEAFGLALLSDADLESFLHHWRSVGHRLGVSERLNLCAGSLAQVRSLCHLVEQRLLVPQLRRPDAAWHGLTRALYDGLGGVFATCRHDVWLLYVMHDVLGLHTPHLYAALSWADRVRYRLLRAIYRHANHYPQMHEAIRRRAKAEFTKGAQEEGLPQHLTYVLELL